MTAIVPLMPRQPVPDLMLPTVGGGPWRLAEQRPENFTLLVVYRGLHCPICASYLRDLQRRLDDFTARGIRVFVLSSDDRARAEQAVENWDIGELTVGYGLGLSEARRWGLYISRGRGKPTSAGVYEPALFVEPGMFLIRPDGTLFFGTVQTMPFARPTFADILKAVDYVLENDYPARGEIVDEEAGV
jgi:hypothetical protein